MKILTKSEIQNLSFPDCTVEKMQVNISERVAKIRTDIGYISSDGGIKLKNCKLTVKNWRKLQASLYRAKTEGWEKLNINDIEKLVDICEFNYGEEIIFRGFGEKTGQWIEIIFLNGNLKVECD